MPADYRKLAACDPLEAIWLVFGRSAAHNLLDILNDTGHVEKTYADTVAPAKYTFDPALLRSTPPQVHKRLEDIDLPLPPPLALCRFPVAQNGLICITVGPRLFNRVDNAEEASVTRSISSSMSSTSKIGAFEAMCSRLNDFGIATTWSCWTSWRSAT
jgi:hypothetical protein